MAVIYIVLLIFSLFYILAALVAIIFFLSTLQTIFITKVPFVPVPKEVLPNIIKALELKDGSIMYDLGCGDARVLVEAAKLNESARFVGIECMWFPLVLARLRVWRNKKNKQIKIHNQNFFEVDLSNATHVFLYLLPKIMDKLLPKLECELQSGTKLVSCSFKFSDKKEKEIINLNRKKNQLARELYVYEF